MTYGSNRLRAGPPGNNKGGLRSAPRNSVIPEPPLSGSSLKAGPPDALSNRESSTVTLAYEDAMDQMENVSAIDKEVTNFENYQAERNLPNMADHYFNETMLKSKLYRWLGWGIVIGSILGEFGVYSTLWGLLPFG